MSIKCSEVVNYNICHGYYRFISQIFEEEIKYIKSYKTILNDYFKKVLNLQITSGIKLGKPPEEFANASWLNLSPLLKMTELIPKIIHKQLENIKYFLDELDKKLKGLDDLVKDKSSEIKRLQQKYEESSGDLIKKYIDVEKAKISFLHSMNKSEDIIGKYYDNKYLLDIVRNNNKNDSQLKSLIERDKEYDSQKKNIISSSKKHETEYNNIVNKTLAYEYRFLSAINECINGIKDASCEISGQLKDILDTFLSSIRESYKAPLDIMDNYLSNSKEENGKENMNKIMMESFNNQSKLTNLIPERYNLKAMELNENKNGEENYFNKKKGFVKFEDGFEEMSYFEDDIALYSVKEMLTTFELVNYSGINIEIEEEKNLTKKYINKIISFMSNKTLNIDKYLEEDEKNNLMNLLDKHHNRIIFLHKLNDYRALCKYELREKEYKLLGELFFYIINTSKQEKDYHSIEMVIILSKTYFYIKENQKIYLQNLIIDNKYFKTKDFWESLLIYSISKDVAQSNRRDSITDHNRSEIDKKKESKQKNIIFSQLLSFIDNMFDFGADDNMIKEIIEPKMIFYKIEDNLKDTINDVIVSRTKAKNNNNNNIKDDKKRER